MIPNILSCEVDMGNIEQYDLSRRLGVKKTTQQNPTFFEQSSVMKRRKFLQSAILLGGSTVSNLWIKGASGDEDQFRSMSPTSTRVGNSGPKALSAADLKQIKEMFDQSRKKHSIVGAGLAVLDGGIIHEFTSGIRDIKTGKPVTTETVFLIGSTTKTFNATLVMQLVDEGKLDLDSPVKRYLPDLKLSDPKATETLTTRHLLAMTSGIDSGPYLSLQGRDAVEWYVAGLANIPHLHPPGALFGYSNAGATVAGRIVERLTGLDWDSALKYRLLEPLGLKASASLPDEVEHQELVTSHMLGPAGKPTRIPGWHDRAFGPAGSTLRQSAGDLLRYAKFHLNQGKADNGLRLLSPESVTLMQEPQSPTPPKGFLCDAWCLGCAYFNRGGERILGHTGGHWGQNSELWFLPDREYPAGVAMVTNSQNAGGFYPEVLSWVFRNIFGIESFFGSVTMMVAPKLPDSPVKIDLRPYTGVFKRYRHTSKVTLKGDKLLLTISDETLPQVKPSRTTCLFLRPLNQEVFAAFSQADGTGERGVLVAFTGFKNGRPEFIMPITPRLDKRTISEK